jgi:hypothetical protein
VRFDIEPGVGALPVRFGMPKSQVRALLGPPEGSTTIWDNSGTVDFWFRSTVNVGYDNDGLANHLGFSPGDFELTFRGTVIWSLCEQPDPNLVLLRFDPAPFERLGFLVFNGLGVTTTGYHDDDEPQRALTIYLPAKWDQHLAKASVPDLSRYSPEAK